jgi:vanillate O-demethylase ferredoxin subunit
MTTLSVTVREIRQEALDIKSFLLADAGGHPLPAFTAGSHIDVHIGNGLIRQYSLCNGPDQTDAYLIAVKREPQSRGGSAAMHELKQGDTVTIGTPRNNFPLAADASHHVLLAAGIGITPLLSMARHLRAAQASFELHYFTRSPEHAAFRELLSAPERTASFYHGLQPEDMQQRLHTLLEQRRAGAHLYFCGPRPFMDMTLSCAAPAWPPGTVHLEYFAADPAALAGPQETFKVRLAKRGVSFDVPAGTPITAVLAEHGCAIETSCEQGVCGTCLTGVLEGIPDHRDVFLTEAERSAGNKMLPCVSRARSPVLVLDL